LAETKLEFVDVENIEEQQSSNRKRNMIIAACVLVAAVAVVLVLYLILIVPATSEAPEIYVTEVVTSNNLSYVDETLGSPDWIELYNASSFDVSLEGYGISDIAVLPYRYTFGDVTIGAGEYLVVYATQERGTEHICLGFSLAKEGETIVLTDPEGVIVQMLEVPVLSEDKSWGLTGTGEYKYIANPTVGSDNSDITADTLTGFEWMIEKSKVTINEIMPGASELIEGEAGQFAWIEVYNTAGEPVNLQNFYLSDNIDNIKKWRFPDMELAANDYVVVYISGLDTSEGELHTNFQFSQKETTVYFTDGNIGISSEVSWEPEIAEHVSVGLDANGEMKYFSVPTPGEQNATIAFDSFEHTQMGSGLTVNEILLDNAYSIMDEDGDRSAWVEFFNNSVRTVALGDLYLSDSEGNPYKWQMPNIMLESGEYLVVFLSGKDKSGDELHTNFGIGDDENALIITDRANMQESVFALDFSVKKNISYGIAGEGEWQYFGQPTPGSENTSKGFEEIASAGLFDIGGVYINEVSAVGAPKSGDVDWIEIRNGSNNTVNLSGYYLSDSLDEPYMWQIPDVSVGSGGYAVIYASSATAEQSGDTAPFSIAASGETLVLSSPDGVLIDYFDTGVMNESNSVGRLSGDESGSRVFFTSSTIGKANADAYFAAYTSEPQFSQLGGYTDKGTVVQINCADESALIYYTINGDRPTTSSTLYADGVQINESLPLRAIAVSADKLDSPIVTTNYLVEKQHDIAVLCISGDEDDINYAYRVTEIFVKREGEVHVEYYEPGGQIGVEFPGAIRVSGASTRTYSQKSLNIYLRGGYGQSSVTYPFFDDYELTEFKSLTIRNSGQDLYHAHIRTSFAEMLVNGMDMDNTQQKPVAVYINGEYWGMYWLCENQNEDFYATKYDLERENIEIIKRNTYPLAGGSRDGIREVRAFARGHDMEDEENYQEFITMVDEDSIIDYLIAQTFFGNSDMFNQKYWREADFKEEWHLVFYDIDYIFHGSLSRNLLPSYFNKNGIPSANGTITNMDLPYALLQNEGWKQKFIERYAYLLNTQLSKENVLALFDSMVEQIETEMERHIKRRGIPYSMSYWRGEIKDLRYAFSVRTKYCKQNLQEFFNLSNERMEELFPDGGY
jgi:signal peptidase I